jgi:flagellar basal body-associated protein FliL
MSKGIGSKRVIALLIIIIVVVAAGVAFWLSSSSKAGNVSANGKIEIPANGVQVSTGVHGGIGSTANVTVDNIGSVPVTITTIYVNGGSYPSGPPGGKRTRSGQTLALEPHAAPQTEY